MHRGNAIVPPFSCLGRVARMAAAFSTLCGSTRRALVPWVAFAARRPAPPGRREVSLGYTLREPASKAALGALEVPVTPSTRGQLCDDTVCRAICVA